MVQKEYIWFRQPSLQNQFITNPFAGGLRSLKLFWVYTSLQQSYLTISFRDEAIQATSIYQTDRGFNFTGSRLAGVFILSSDAWNPVTRLFQCRLEPWLWNIVGELYVGRSLMISWLSFMPYYPFFTWWVLNSFCVWFVPLRAPLPTPSKW